MDLKEVNYQIQEKIRNFIPLRLTDEQEVEFRYATSCCICRRSYEHDRKRNGEIRDPKLIPCRHHSHISGKRYKTYSVFLFYFIFIINFFY